MVNDRSILIRSAGAAGVAALLLVLAGLAAAGMPFFGSGAPVQSAMAITAPPAPKAAPTKPAPPPPVLPPPVNEVLQSGVLIVISKASQTMYVFKNGELWGTSPVSTGKRGKATPAGVFPILQKKVFHRSNLYSNAPMPHMQRLTWSGIAIHAGRLPGYPASHGCIRLPAAFAKSLYALTRADNTTVVITNSRVASAEKAIELALAAPAPRRPVPGVSPQPIPTAVAASPRIEPLPLVPVQAPIALGGQTIQLTAAPSPAQADAHWARLIAQHPELTGLQKQVVSAVVKGRQVYRLRTSGPGAHSVCAALKRAGETCFNVN